MTTHRTRIGAIMVLALCAYATSAMGDQWKITFGETTVSLNERAVATEDIWLEPTGEAARVFRTADGLHEASFVIDPASDFVVTIDDDGDIHYQGTIGHQGGLALGSRGKHQMLSTLTIGAQQAGGGTQFAVLDLPQGSSRALILAGAEISIDPAAGTLFIASSDLRLSPSWAKSLNLPQLSQDAIGSITIRAALQRVDGDDLEAATPPSTDSDAPGVTTAGTIGADVIVGVLHNTSSFGSSGTISAFSIGTTSCNAGDVELEWFATNSPKPTKHPVIAQNMFRLKSNRFEQIGQSWLKHGFFALQGNACGFGCINAQAGGTLLGVGCSDPYGAGINGQQTNLGPKSDVNPFTGSFVRTAQDFRGFDVIDRRLQVYDVDLDPALNPDAIYFAEGHYVMPDDAMAGHGENNASYRRILIGLDNGMNDETDPCNNVFGIDQGEFCVKFTNQFLTQRRESGIRAWKDQDPDVRETEIRVPDEGLFILAAKAIDLGNGTWEYEYALQNLNSNRSCGSFSLPLPIGTIIVETGFHDVDHHSSDTGGANYDGTDWPATVTDSFISWSTGQHATSPNANALRWSTLYNFRFVTNAGPGETEVTLGLFRPGDPASVTGTTIGPSVGLADCNENGIPDSCDISCEALGCKGECGGSLDCIGNGIPDECEPDCNGNGVTDACDLRDGTSIDCQPNGIPDSCEADCDGDSIPDDCDVPEDCDADGITDCEDFCPCSSPVGGCVCPEIDDCCWVSFGCMPGWLRDDCFASLGTPLCGESPCVSGCTLDEIDGDVDRDGDLDLFDGGNLFVCFSGPLDDPGYVKPNAECLARFDFDDNKTIDLTDYQKLQTDLSGPLPQQ